MNRRADRALLVEQVLGARRAGVSDLGRIPQRAEPGPAPISAAQRRLWILHRLDPESPGSNRPLALRLSGPLDERSLGRSLGEIVRRHEALRTTFLEEAGEPLQLVHRPEPLPLRALGLEALPEAEREVEARRIASAEARQPIDLAKGPLTRAVLLRLGSRDHVLLLLLHHIAFDGWSEGVLVRELAALYGAFAAGQDSPLPELAIQCADFAAWQREQLTADGRLEEQLRYWRSRLEPLPPALDLPSDYPMPAARTSRSADCSFVLPAAVALRLRDWCRRERVTPFMTLVSAFQALLGRYARQDNFLIGVPVAGRTRAETEALIGCFMNVVVMRADLSGQPSFRELVRRSREQTLESYAHQELPFERLVQELRPERRPNRWPLFDVMFNLRVGQGRGSTPAGDIRIAPFAFDRGTIEGLALYLQVEDGGSAPRFTWTYATELFREETIVRLGHHFQTLLESALREPERPIASLPIVTETERLMLVDDWNRTAADSAGDVYVHELVAGQARRTPDAVAIVFQGESLSYRELDRKANQVGQHLRRLGVGPESIVGLYLERSLDLFVGILGVLKAGAAYLPLDPDAPRERTRLMIDDAGAAVVLTHQRLLGDFPPTGARTIPVDAAGWAIGAEPAESPASSVVPDNLAYVLYTSGSTGRPKAVMVSHRALCNHLLWRLAYFSYGETDRVLHSASLGFDDAIWETLAPLLSGARAILVPPGAHQDPAQLVRILLEERPTIACFVPSLLGAVLAQPGIERCTSLRAVDTGGEVLPVELQDRLHATLRADLYNGYGPAEATVACTFWLCTREPGQSTVPIGRPIANTRLYVLDGHLLLVPVGVPGELCIGGVGVARGYLGRPGSTAAAFLPDPFDPARGGRMYRTGDLVRYRHDGVLEFLGRLDDQVKIRGNRVEPGEVEAVLRGHGSVEETAVVVREDARGEKCLVAFVVQVPGTDQVAPTLRAYLRERLPDYMVPAAFVRLEALPRTPAGKLDRRALPAAELSEAEDAYLAPRTATEERVAGIWAELLRRERVGVQDNFFALGGHSLVATQVIARIQAAFGVEVPLRAVFDAPTVADLAERVDAALTEPRTPVPPSDGDDILDPEVFVLPTSFAQRRLWLLDQLEPNSSVYNMTQAFHLTGLLDLSALERALQSVVDRHEVLRTRVAAVDGTPVQLVAPRGSVSLRVTDLSALPAEGNAAALRLASEESARPFDLTRGPLLRARLFRLADEEHVLVLVMHHIVSDGWSLGVLYRELGTGYGAYRQGELPGLPALPVQYADYAIWQQEWLRGAVLEGELAYWRGRLAGAPPLLRLPTDRPRPAGQSYRGARETLALPGGLATGLQALGRAEGATLFMTLLGAWAVLLGRYSGQSDLVVGSPIAGRTRSELEGLIGFFVNTLALRLDLSGDPSFRVLLGRVREVALGAYAHQELPFERLVEELQPPRTLQHHAVFQVLFQVSNTPSSPLQLPGLEVATLELERSTAKFDLSLAVHEEADGLRCSCTYSTELFAPQTIRHLLDQYRVLLEQIVTAPDNSIDAYSLLTERSRALLPDPRAALEELSYPSVIDAFAAWVRASPVRPAIERCGRCWTYGQLAAAAESLARALAARGVRCGDVVALTGPPSFGLVAAMLGTLSCAAVMLPIDPRLPERRKHLMLREASARHLVLVEAGASDDAGFPGVDAPPSLRVDPMSGRISEPAAERPASEPGDPLAPRPDDAAYVFFTSGTLGVPKAVLGVHKALAHFLAWQRETFRIVPSDRCGQLSNISFDVILRDVFLPLCGGATLCLPPDHLSPDRVLSWVASERITILHAVPSLAQAWVEALPRGATLSSLRWVFFAGEPLTDTLVRRWRSVLGEGCGVVNLYGPTEATMVKCFHRVPTEIAVGTQAVGRPLPESQALVLTQHSRLCGVNETGEIVLRSPFLTRGYLNAPDEQRQRFIVNPFGDDPRDRLYRTGDLGHYRWDGSLLVLTRLDDQIKIRGVRIEPGEVGAVLARHPGIRACTVVGRPDGPGEVKLIAYVVREEAVGSGVLQAYLAEHLPSAMIPSAFVFVPELPLTPNGKVDRRALPAPAVGQFEPPESRVGPRSPTEQALAAIWCEVLRLEQVGVHDDFFALGGHSLVATQVIARIQVAFGVEVPLRAVFDAPTVAGLALAIQEQQASRQRSTGDVAPPATWPAQV